ncbi:hypothetical protein WKK05_36245 (plasmid) [Nostoc sp. UHCC 0302]|uniref:hypothetical protein n=1 Tax=Nostoc sp. UHCC 0302 TaxID=3134896 RepID=UPI00311CD11C
MTATITRPKSKKSSAASIPQSPYKRFHVIIPIEDMLWASQQKYSITQLWQECWTADPYGSRWMPLSTGLGYSTFIAAKKILSDSGLFIFKPDKSIQDGRETVGWMIRNLHGSRMKEFWEGIDSASQKTDAEKQAPNSENTEMDAGSKEIRALYRASISDQSQSEQGFQEPSRTVQEHLTNSPKELVRCTSSTQKENTRDEVTADAPFGGASPQTLESVEEEKELPAVTDCTSLALVDAVQGQSALLLGEKQDCRVEAKNPHEGTYSAAPVAPDFEEPASPSLSTSLTVENSVFRVEVKADNVDPVSAASALCADKWSNEAIAARSKARPGRMQKLKLAEVLRENTGFEFLAECWNDDPALQIVVKKLVTKFPQWGIACVDGVLVDWEQ